MTRLEITVDQPAGVDPWPEAGHHMRIMCFDVSRSPMKDVYHRDLAVRVGTSVHETKPGAHVLRLFGTEGSYVEEQIEIGEGETGAVSFTLEAPLYAYRRPTTFGLIDTAAIDVATAWSIIEGRWDGTAPMLPVLDQPVAPPTSPGVHMAYAEGEGTSTIFMLPRSVGAEFDVRQYGDADGRGIERQRVRLRYAHPVLGMVLPHLAMMQISDAMPHVLDLVADGTFDAMCADGDACGAMAIAHVLAADRHQNDPTQVLTSVAEAFPDLPDPLLMLAYGRLFVGKADGEVVDLVRRSLALGPPCFTMTVSTLNSLAMHLEHVPDVVARRRIASQVDPGCLFTSIRLRPVSKAS